MDDNAEVMEEGVEGVEEQGPKPQAAVPPPDELRQLVGSLAQQVQTLATSFNAVVADRQARGQKVIEDVSDDDLNDAFEQGDRKRYEALQRQREAFKEAKWEQRIAQLEEQGTKAISSLMRKSVDGLPRAAEVSTRIDQIVAALPANLQLNPEAYQQSYVMALGEKYLEELKTGKAAVGSKKAVVNTPGKGGAVNAAPKVTFEVPPAALAELARRGMTLDDQARELGYESWAAYQADDEEGK